MTPRTRPFFPARLGPILALSFAATCVQARAEKAWAAQAGYFSLGIQPSFFGGNFGGTKVTNIYEQLLTLRYHGSGWRVSIQLPALAVSGPGFVSGQSVINGEQRQGVSVGIGDIWLGGDASLVRPSGLWPGVKPYMRLKIPTASRSKGLGTGAADFEFGSRFEWNTGNNFQPFALAGYRVVGKAPGLNLHNAFVWAVGASLLFGQRQYVSVLFDGRSSMQQGAGSSDMIVASYGMQFTTTLSGDVFAVHGLTQDSPKYGGGCGVTWRF